MMICPFCQSATSRVLETRAQPDGSLRRRRVCQSCGQRYSTAETVMTQGPYIAKRDGRRERFTTEKLRRGLTLACRKRPISTEQIEAIVENIRAQLLTSGDAEMPAERVGRLAMEELKKVDPVAYLRFASVYQNFNDPREFLAALDLET